MSRNLLATICILMLVPAVLLSLAACSGEKAAEKTMERALEQASGQDVDIDLEKGGREVHVRGEGGHTDMVETAQWPADMFAGVPEFTLGKVYRVHSGEDGGMRKFNVFLKEVAPDAGRRYADDLEAAGWEASLTEMGGKGAMLGGQKGDLGINVILDSEKREAMVAVFRTPSE